MRGCEPSSAPSKLETQTVVDSDSRDSQDSPVTVRAAAAAHGWLTRTAAVLEPVGQLTTDGTVVSRDTLGLDD